MTEIAEADPNGLILVLADMARSDPPMSSAFMAEFSRRLQGTSPALAMPLTWIEQRLSQAGLTISELVQTESQQQAADQVSISNSIRKRQPRCGRLRSIAQRALSRKPHLSHDLLEGCHTRSGLLSDVQVIEADPWLYSADVKRRRRWIRGDWQIARRLLPRVPGASGSRDNPLSALSRWKIFDNLRRSLAPAAMTALLLLAWAILARPWLWTLAVIAVIAITPLLRSLLEIPQRPKDILWRQHLAATARSAWRRFTQAGFTLICLPYEAMYSMDAIFRTVWRMAVTRRHLLEWSTSGDDRHDFSASLRAMWIGPAIAMAAGVSLVTLRPAALLAAAPVLALWLVSPAVAWWMGRPITTDEANRTADQAVLLRKAARRTWSFFETFVGPQDHWLPPDNYQEAPTAVIAHRTSPTNIGLSLLANLAAYDFGYLESGQLVERTALALQTMAGMERYQGHFYNWYDTQSLKPLPPRYVSTVDSGNLAGHLQGITDTLGVMADLNGRSVPVEIRKAAESPFTMIADARERLEQLSKWAEAETFAPRFASSQTQMKSPASGSARSTSWHRSAANSRLRSTDSCSAGRASSRRSAITSMLRVEMTASMISWLPRRSSARSNTERCGEYPGAFPNRATTRSTVILTIGTARSACRAWGQNSGWRRIW